MIITYRDFKRLEFPVFKLKSNNWYTADGLVFLDGEILDDRNMEGKTLGARRLQSPFTNLYQLKECCQTSLALMKNTSGNYVDNLGRIFVYTKTKMVSLKYYKIRKIERKDTLSILWAENVNFGVRIPRPPPAECTWAGFLHIQDKPWMLYEYAVEKCKNTQRKI